MKRNNWNRNVVMSRTNGGEKDSLIRRWRSRSGFAPQEASAGMGW
jgi:hypothetical protein